MITTLRTGALSLASVQYKFTVDSILTVKLTTSTPHTIYGNVNITLANVININIYDSSRTLVSNYFNSTLSFTRTGATTLEYTARITSGIAQQESFATLSNNGSSITATVANSYIDLGAGTYNFLLLDTSDSVFSTSSISVQQLDVGGTGVAGVKSLFYASDDTSADPMEFSINNVDLTFSYNTRISIENNVSGTTNIPLIIT